MAFTYKNLTEASRPYYLKLLALDAAHFFKWRAKRPYDLTLEIDVAFKRWWLGKGRVDFKSFDDTRRYRAELLELIRTVPHD